MGLSSVQGFSGPISLGEIHKDFYIIGFLYSSPAVALILFTNICSNLSSYIFM